MPLFAFFLLMVAALLPLRAQLVLPEYLFPEDPPPGQPTVTPTPPPADSEENSGGYLRPDNPHIIQLMQQGSPIVIMGGRRNNPSQPSPPPDESRRVRKLMSGPAEVAASIRTSKGSIAGTLKNQIVQVRASFGVTPLRLSEIRLLERLPEGGFRFEIEDGDLLVGKFERESLTVSLPDGASRVVPLKDIERVEIKP